jgi:hypothetical protein
MRLAVLMRRSWNGSRVHLYVQGVTDNYKNTSDLLVTFTGPDELSDLLREYRDQLDEINMCVDPDWMPFEAISESGELMGISSELFPMVARQLGKPIRLVVTETWSESMDRARKVNAISCHWPRLLKNAEKTFCSRIPCSVFLQ